MTSIERAMDKIDRSKGLAVEDTAELESADSDSAQAVVARQSDVTEIADPPVKAAPELGPGVGDSPEAKQAQEHPAVLPAAQPNSTTSNFVALQSDRLAAGGFLTPEGGRTRQQEEYQQIKRRLLGNMLPDMLPGPNPPNLVMVTSSVPGEGKTFTSSNLAISIAMEIDHTVLAVDTDIIKSDMSGAFGVRGRKGLYDLLGDPTLKLEDLLVRTSIPNLVILPSGTHGKSSTEHLASAYMKSLLSEMASRYPDRVVLFDSPPILATTTAATLAQNVGQLLIVVEAGKTKQETLSDALRQIEGVPVTGLILNKAKQSTGPGYGYYGYYGYETNE